MIPVIAAAEPDDFDDKVRQPGVAWLVRRGFTGIAAFPPRTKVLAAWTACLPELLSSYDRICAYASLRIHPVTGAQSVDHFAPKSRTPAQTYEWSNYRLACAKMNARKNNFTDVMDPFVLAPNSFVLNVLDGSIEPSPHLVGADLALAEKTIRRLRLDDQEMRGARTGLITSYFEGRFDTIHLQNESPFIYQELDRQGLLQP